MAGARPIRITGYAALFAAFGIACTVSAVGGPNPVALALLIPLAAAPSMRGHMGLSLALVASAPVWVALAASFLERADKDSLIINEALGSTMIWFALAASAGYVVGRAIYNRIPFGSTMAVAIGLPAAGALLFIIAAWNAWADAAAQAFQMLDADIVAAAKEGNVPSETRDARRALLKFLLVDHLLDLSFGLYVVTATLTTAPVAACLGLIARVRSLEGGYSRGWMEARTPDWLAWAAVAVGAAWLVNDQVYTHAVLRAFSWNGALVLAAIYWINGIGLSFYMLRSIGVHWSMWIVFGFVLLMFPHANITMSIVGLFDTWADFRSRTDRAIAAAQQRDKDDDRPA